MKNKITDEEAAAIAVALNLHCDIHDNESFIITIKLSGNNLWNNKILTFRNIPVRNKN